MKTNLDFYKFFHVVLNSIRRSAPTAQDFLMIRAGLFSLSGLILYALSKQYV